MTLDIPSLKNEYINQYPIYNELVEKIKQILSGALHAQQIQASVDGRAKELPNLLKKAIRKHAEKPDQYADALREITDKAGVRIIVDHLGDAERVRQIICEGFEVLDFEDMKNRYKPNELGYLGLHLQVRLLDDQVEPDELHLRGRECEIQVHTHAQSAWARVSHPLLYKPPAGEPVPEVASKVMRAVALVSLFDEQVEEARTRVSSHPSYRPSQMLYSLERLFAPWMERPTDDQLSLTVLDILQHLFDEGELVDFAVLMDTFVTSRRGQIDAVYEAFADRADEQLLLFQPEALAIYELLVTRPALLRAAWVECALPNELLDDLAEVFAIPIEPLI
jgi:ppGpp synthetase/RelA/SpoT-type nucleotidyltranferase